MTKADILNLYPYFTDEAAEKALAVWKSADPFLAAITPEAFPRADIRNMLIQQISSARNSAVQMIGQA